MYENVRPEDLGLLNAAITLPLERGPAVLVELVDNGPKNHAVTNDFEETVSIDIPCVVPAGTYMIYRKSLLSTDTDSPYCLGRFYDDSSGSNVTVKSIYLKRHDTAAVATITIDKPATFFRIYASDTAAHSTGDTVSGEDFMICSAADWKISETYQPFRPSYQELYERVVALEDAE
ncbi:MAG: hypothetical protein IKW20_03660 [Bacteroidales bacterium]|nr:hypothetical protein [Bacteroidales bacterium]